MLSRLNRKYPKTIIIVTQDAEYPGHALHIRRLIKGQLLNHENRK